MRLTATYRVTRLRGSSPVTRDRPLNAIATVHRDEPHLGKRRGWLQLAAQFLVQSPQRIALFFREPIRDRGIPGEPPGFAVGILGAALGVDCLDDVPVAELRDVLRLRLVH